VLTAPHDSREICVNIAQETHMDKTEKRDAAKVRLNLSLSEEANNVLQNLSDDTGASRAEIFKQALALLKVAVDAKKKGKHLGITDDAEKLDREIVGLL
jgi:hypothetical protein